MTDRYESPFSARYSSEYMKKLFSSDTRYQTFRKLWTALARAEKSLGLPITDEQIKDLEDNISNIDYDTVAAREKETRHDVMAHIYAYGKAAPSAAGIIHLGATSCFVTDNADLIIYRDALSYIRKEVSAVILALCDFAEKYKDVPALGYTHYQPAQPVTVGKRATLYIQDLVSDLEEIDFAMGSIKFLGSRGTTGTEASFLDLFDGDVAKADEMNRLIANEFSFNECFDVCSQTYPRKLDARILNALSSLAQSACKAATDIRLLQHDMELEEPFEEDQVGSSAMAYKRNPMRCERICSLSRFLINNAGNAPLTAATQWLERTLDDSAVRRITMPEGFLAADAILRLYYSVAKGLKINEKIIEKNVSSFLPFIATENIMMEAVKRGADRQAVHEIIRKCSMKATAHMKDGGKCILKELLAEEDSLKISSSEIDSLLDPAKYTGRCGEQVSDYISKVKLSVFESDAVEPDEIVK